MGKIKDISNKLKSLNVMAELDLVLQELQGVIVGMNKEQLSLGYDAQHSQLQDYAQESYAGFKVDVVGSRAPLGTPDLKLSGDFYNGFKIILNASELIITSDDIKTLQLEGKYGDIFGLDSNHLEMLSISYILPKLQQRIKQYFIL
jgi:hypothetical protein